ncbi:MAG: methyltransferase domain-containing protein, partial [Thermoleophilia bacterium]|nr:methyltransferase domain-containing protein [Thermoleophilia bacterium]
MSGVDPGLRAHLRIGEPSNESFVDAAFGLVLRRPPEAEAREIALARLADGTLSRAALLRDLVGSPEFDRVRQLDDVIAFARGARERGERPRHLQAPPETDERLVEIPWVLSRLRSGRVLEVGYAFAEPAYLAGLVEAAPGELVGVDLAHAEVPGFETVTADARDLPFVDASIDQILLVSTLEHIGADNELYGSDTERDESGRFAALRELRRVLRPDGSLLVTVPLGEPGDHGWFRQDDI